MQISNEEFIMKSDAKSQIVIITSLSETIALDMIIYYNCDNYKIWGMRQLFDLYHRQLTCNYNFLVR